MRYNPEYLDISRRKPRVDHFPRDKCTEQTRERRIQHTLAGSYKLVRVQSEQTSRYELEGLSGTRSCISTNTFIILGMPYA